MILTENIVIALFVLFVLYTFYQEYRDQHCSNENGECNDPSTFRMLEPKTSDTPRQTLYKLYLVSKVEQYKVMWRRYFLLAVLATFLVILYYTKGNFKNKIEFQPDLFNFVLIAALIFFPFYYSISYYFYHEYKDVIKNSDHNYHKLLNYF